MLYTERFSTQHWRLNLVFRKSQTFYWRGVLESSILISCLAQEWVLGTPKHALIGWGDKVKNFEQVDVKTFNELSKGILIVKTDFLISENSRICNFKLKGYRWHFEQITWIPYTRSVRELQFKMTREATSHGSNFYSIDSWGLFKLNLFCGKNLNVGAPGRGQQYGIVNYFSVLLSEIFNFRLYMNDRGIWKTNYRSSAN